MRQLGGDAGDGMDGGGDSGSVGGIVSNGQPSQVSMRRIRHVVGGTCERSGASNCGGGRIRPTKWRRHHIRKIVQQFVAVTGQPATKRPSGSRNSRNGGFGRGAKIRTPLDVIERGKLVGRCGGHGSRCR